MRCERWGVTVVADWLRPGDVFAGYTIEAIVGQGGMGRIYRARHPRLPRAVALKMLNPTQTSDPSFITRFEREADHAARVEHPNVVTVYDRGVDDGHPWISMQFITGSDAAAAVTTEGPLPVDRAVYIISEIARGLDHAHSLGVLHRDVKPANIMLSPTPQGPERVLLTDFGIAKAVAEETGLTETGTIISSLPFAAPEVLYGHTLDGRTDQYSLAATLYTLLAGSPPFPGPNQAEIVAGHLSGAVPELAGRRRDVPPALDAVIARGMAKEPADRFPSCTDFAAAARAALRSSAPPLRPTAVAPPPHLPPRPPTGPRSQPPAEPRSQPPWSQPTAAPDHWSHPRGAQPSPQSGPQYQNGPQHQSRPQHSSGPYPPQGAAPHVGAPHVVGAVPFPSGQSPSPGPHPQSTDRSGSGGPSGPTREWTGQRPHQVEPTHTGPPPAPAAGASRGILIGIAVAVVALLAAAGITAFLVLGDDSDSSASGLSGTTTSSSGDSGQTTGGQTTSPDTTAATGSEEEAIWAAASQTRSEFADILPPAPLAVGYMNMACVATDSADRPVYAQFESKFDCAARGGTDFELFTYSDPSGVEQYINNLPTRLPTPYPHVSERGTRMNMYRFESPEGNWVLVLFEDDPYRDNLVQLEIPGATFSQMIDWLVDAPL